MVFYILLVVVVICLFRVSFVFPRFEKAVSLILLGIMILIGGFRDRMGWDYSFYTNWYLYGTRDDGLEFGFLGIMKIFRYLNLDYHFLFFFFSFFTYLFAYLGVKKYTKNSSLPLVLYFLIPVLFLYSFTYVRQFLSVTIAFYAFSYLIEKKYISYLLLMFVGFSIHYSCIFPFIVFILVFGWGSLLKSHHLYILMALTFILGQIGIIHWFSLFLNNSHYSYYVTSEFSKSVPLLKLVLMNAMGLFVINHYDKNRFIYPNQKYLVAVYICSILFLNVFSESIQLTRLYIYFRIFEIILVAEIIYATLRNKRFWLLSCICCFYLFPFFRAIQIDYETAPENLKLIPYKSLLLK
jgi:hypothetical protein